MHVVKEVSVVGCHLERDEDRAQKKDEEHWPRLFSEKKVDKQYVTTDWSRYVDEDEEEDDGGFDMCAPKVVVFLVTECNAGARLTVQRYASRWRPRTFS